MPELPYTIAIATRNRLDALRLSIPRMVSQSRKPSQIVVADSSDNHEAIHSAITEITKSTGIPTTILKTEKGITHQRNRALEHVANPVVFFPDDDSIWFPDTAEIQMRVYERDTQNEIAAVCGMQSESPPDDFYIKNRPVYKMRKKDRWKLRIAPYLNRFKQRFIPDPAYTLGQEFFRLHDLPSWVDPSIVKVEWMTGFRMSFRTNVIKCLKFDETLNEYCLFEDIEASFAAWKMGLVVADRKARVFHHKSPENRSAGKKLGATHILNKAYIIAKHSKKNSKPIRQLRRYSKYKCFQYSTFLFDSFSRDRYRGAREATKHLKLITNSNYEHLKEQYMCALNACIEK